MTYILTFKDNMVMKNHLESRNAKILATLNWTSLVFPQIACERIRNEINIRKYRFLIRNFGFFRVIRNHNSKFSNKFRTSFEIFRNSFRSWKH